jgi:small subunit ribosomal protein S1
LSWKKVLTDWYNPSEFVKVGEKLNVIVLELDAENRRLALGHKHLEENPWNTFETIFTPGSTHKGTINSKNDKGAIIELPYGIEGFATNKHLAKEDGKIAEVGESLDLKVLEFSKDEKKIILSHTRVHSADAIKEDVVEKKKPAKTAKPKVEAEKQTLGDIEALSNLKGQMTQDGDKKAPKPEGEEKKKAAKPKAKKEEGKSEE